MADVATSKNTTYASLASTSDAPLNAAPPPPNGGATAERDAAAAAETGDGPSLPAYITAPIESALGTLGKLAGGVTTVVGERGMRATSKARPWLEFIDFSAFKLDDGASGSGGGGVAPYVERLRMNIPYFLFNYIIVGLALTVVSVITKPVALFGTVFLIWIYFQFFGAETGDDDFRLFGFSLDTHEKVGFMLVLGLLIFWLTAGGVQVFFSVLTASLCVAVIHGVFRKPPASLTAPESEPQVV